MKTIFIVQHITFYLVEQSADPKDKPGAYSGIWTAYDDFFFQFRT